MKQENGLIPERHRAYSALLSLPSAVIAHVGVRLKEGGVSSPRWYAGLLILEYAPEGRLRMGELHAGVTMSRIGLTPLVDRLEAAEYVSRRLTPDDRRLWTFSPRSLPKNSEHDTAKYRWHFWLIY